MQVLPSRGLQSVLGGGTDCKWMGLGKVPGGVEGGNLKAMRRLKYKEDSK